MTLGMKMGKEEMMYEHSQVVARYRNVHIPVVDELESEVGHEQELELLATEKLGLLSSMVTKIPSEVEVDETLRLYGLVLMSP